MPTTIDCQYMHPEVAAAYLVRDGDEVAFVETNTAHAVPQLLAALKAEGSSPEAVRWIAITHIHLDHAGGAGALMQLCPNATLLAHPRAAPHAIDPARIVAGATKVYGEARFAELYGEVTPIDASRVRVMEDGEQLDLGQRTWTFLHTRGHANHHFCIYDDVDNGVYTGDSFGILYPAAQRAGLFAFPSTSPTDFDGVAALESIDRILGTGADRVWPTHFGEQTDLMGIADQLREILERSMELIDRADASGLDGEALDGFFEQAVRRIFEERLNQLGLGGDGQLAEILSLDIDLNAQGLVFAVKKRRYKRSKR